MKRFLLAVIIPALLLGCVKNPHPVVDPIDMNFDWKTTKSVSISVPSSDTKTSGEKVLIKIYKSGGYSESSLLASGVASGSSSFNTVIDLPIGLEEVFVKTIASNGLVSLSSYKVSGTKAYKNTSYGLSTKVGDYNPVDVPRPNIPTQFDREITSASQITGPITENINVLIPAGVNITTNVKDIFANYNQNVISTFYIKGKLKINAANPQISFARVVVLDGGSLEFENGLTIGWTKDDILALYVQKGGKLKVKNSVNFGAKINVVNEGEFIVEGESGHKVEFNNNAKFYNTGEFEVENRELHVTNNSVIYNFGEMDLEYLKFDSNSALYNYKGAEIEADYMYVTNSGAIYQYGELEIDGEMKLQGYFYNYGATKADILSDGNNLNLNCYAGSLLQIGALQRVTNANINTYSHSIITIGAVHTNSSTSNDLYNIKFNNPDNTDYALVIWGPKNGEDTIVFDEYRQIRFNNKIENYCATKSEENNAKYTNDYCTNSAFWGYGRVNDIPSSDYNEGLGKVTDPDEPVIDEWLTSYFPSKDSWATFIFEDLWPYIGDYDMNDAVVSVRLEYLSLSSDPQNLVRYLDIVWKVSAIGSGMDIATGVQLTGIPSSNIASVITNNTSLGNFPISRNANGIESGQTYAVFPLFNSPTEIFDGAKTFINTYKGSTYHTPYEYVTRVQFTTPVTKELLTIADFDMFIVPISETNNDRGREVHLSQFTGTDKLSSRYFTEGFISSPQHPFKASNGMVWAYMVPETFKYPQEAVDITTAYPDFVKWYQSSGTTNNDWYNHGVSQYLY